MASTHPHCQRCHQPSTDAATLCHHCTRALKGTLTHIARMWPPLLEAIGKQTAMGARSGNKPTKASEQPLPINLHASTVADHVKGVLAGWRRVLCEDHDLTPPDDTAPAIALWLRAHAHMLRMHEAAAEAADEITWASGDVTRAVDLPAEKSRIFTGHCPEMIEDGPCPGEVWAIIPNVGEGAPRMECRPPRERPPGDRVRGSMGRDTLAPARGPDQETRGPDQDAAQLSEDGVMGPGNEIIWNER